VRRRPLDPLFYRETRWSAGNPFTLYKFNIFRQDVLNALRAQGTFIDTKSLERNGSLILVGKLIKRIYLDELPQLFNVLRGDMSLVGPRPMNTREREKLLAVGQTYKESIRAGITGHYQACHKTERDMRSQQELDSEYVEFVASNPWYAIIRFDFVILIRTIMVLLRARGI
jgi:lipopolysaccharide/colanic/teichoic acid biosynthesis glycosyltransferase